MRRILLTFLAAVGLMTANAQNLSKIKDALAANKYTEAKSMVETLLASPKNQKNPEILYLKGKVLSAIAANAKERAAMPEARLQALDAFKKREEASYPKWYKNTSLYNPQKDSQTQEETYNSVVNRGTYQNLVDAIPQRKNESRVNYINRFNNLAGKNAVSLARQANVTEPFDPSNLYKLGEWGWKGLNHIAAFNQAFYPLNTKGFIIINDVDLDQYQKDVLFKNINL